MNEKCKICGKVFTPGDVVSQSRRAHWRCAGSPEAEIPVVVRIKESRRRRFGLASVFVRARPAI